MDYEGLELTDWMWHRSWITMFGANGHRYSVNVIGRVGDGHYLYHKSHYYTE